MKAVMLIGVQATGKTTFYRQRFFETHIRLSLDMLRTRHRETLMIAACLCAKQPFVIDNTNPTRAERARHIPRIKAARFELEAYYFHCDLQACKLRNEQRTGQAKIPLAGLLGTYKRLEPPLPDEGFDRLFLVRSDATGGFVTEPWPDETPADQAGGFA